MPHGFLISENIKRIVINSETLDLKVMKNEEEKQATFTFESTSPYVYVEEKTENDTWYITIKKSLADKGPLGFLFDLIKMIPGELVEGTLKVPSCVETLLLKSVSGDIDIKNVKLHEFSFSGVSGDLKVRNSKIDIFSMKSTSGDIHIKGTPIFLAEIKSISGDIHIDYMLKNFKHLKLASVSGDIKVLIEGKENIYLVKSGINKYTTDINSDIPIIKDPTGKPNKRILELSIISGDINIESKEETAREEKFFLGPEEYKILNLLKEGKISEDFAVELLVNLGYTEDIAKQIIKEKGGRENDASSETSEENIQNEE